MKKIDPRFAKFANKKSNAAIKEAFKQEKRQYKKERAAFFEQKKAEAAAKATQSAAPKIERKTTAAAQMPLNKYLAHSGICSRRDAAELIKDGKVKVNAAVVMEPGYKVQPADVITVNNKKVTPAKNLVYILLNKPKDYITTTDDPQKRKTVLDLIKTATTERVYPVGRLDRNTSGVLLITNDGELAQQLTHPSNEIKKIYAATLNKPLEKKDFDKILKGVVLEDGPAPVDVLAYSDMKDKTQIGIEIHNGRNRIVRRIFESVGYEVKHLDRVMFGGLTKKNIERGKFRFLTEKEVRNLKFFGKGKK
ncbi:rRNA pseudouridine synthase [Niabella sp. CC-SYL272]|uniref:pseudouridine synthase n=1 Tax=Niabella agricola TaxID=2891571 RepID=UPI001F26C4BD|nr:pseudouridine synthase [Niabella agricola]MCF3110768.1 rRNA pseudouridine synthase [Niabella agricola]